MAKAVNVGEQARMNGFSTYRFQKASGCPQQALRLYSINTPSAFGHKKAVCNLSDP